MKKSLTACCFLLLTGLLAAQSYEALTDSPIELFPRDLNNAYKTKTQRRVAVHDPSVVVRPGAIDYYFIFGSHSVAASSNNLMDWTMVRDGSEQSLLYGRLNEQGKVVQCSYNQAFRKNETTKVRVLSSGEEVEVDFGSYDASAWNTCIGEHTVQGNMWAPDVIFNPTMNKWCMYLSLNGPRWNSSIILLTSNAVQGPYVYQGPVVFSGFNVTNEPGTDYALTDMSLVLGANQPIPARYKVGNQWGDYWPHCIDPCVFYDKDSSLWLAYGSWSGGIFALQLDETTGLRDYRVNYPLTGTGKNVSVDPYFGKRIAGGYYVSGEGPYIQRIGNYYYLFMSYGFYAPDGGYEMRIFRSTRPDGPYVDAQGVSAVYTQYQMNYGPKAATNRGMKLFGSYQWNTMNMAEIAQGHNSAVVDKEGRAYVVYHTKFNNGTAWHEVRVHQLFQNERKWLVAAPYEYSGEKVTDEQLALPCPFDTAQIVGEYQVLVHRYKMNYEDLTYTKPQTLVLHRNGKITGTYSGSWSLSKGSSQIRIVLGTEVYYGCLIEQTIDLTDIKALCFTVMSDKGLAVWGSKADSKAVLAMNYKTLTKQFPSSSLSDATMLPSYTTLGAKTTWTSSTPELLKNGQISLPPEGTSVNLRVTISHGNYFIKKDYTLNSSGRLTSVEAATLMPDQPVVYDLFGRPIEEGSLSPGVYVVNGKKTLIKQ